MKATITLTMSRILIVIGVLALLAAPVIWFAGYQWAGHECIEGDRGAALLNGAEGSIEIVDGQCRATTVGGDVRAASLSDWQWDGAALAVAAAGAVFLVGAAATGGRGRSRHAESS
jgi:hypothetical protein